MTVKLIGIKCDSFSQQIRGVVIISDEGRGGGRGGGVKGILFSDLFLIDGFYLFLLLIGSICNL